MNTITTKIPYKPRTVVGGRPVDAEAVNSKQAGVGGAPDQGEANPPWSELTDLSNASLNTNQFSVVADDASGMLFSVKGADGKKIKVEIDSENNLLIGGVDYGEVDDNVFSFSLLIEHDQLTVSKDGREVKRFSPVDLHLGSEIDVDHRAIEKNSGNGSVSPITNDGASGPVNEILVLLETLMDFMEELARGKDGSGRTDIANNPKKLVNMMLETLLSIMEKLTSMRLGMKTEGEQGSDMAGQPAKADGPVQAVMAMMTMMKMLMSTLSGGMKNDDSKEFSGANVSNTTGEGVKAGEQVQAVMVMMISMIEMLTVMLTGGKRAEGEPREADSVVVEVDPVRTTNTNQEPILVDGAAQSTVV